MGPRIPVAAVAVSLLAAGCASAGPPVPGPRNPSPRLHHLLDLEDARVPVAELEPFLRDPDPAVRARAALAAARKGGAGAAAALRAAVGDAEAGVRAAALLGMGLSGDADLAGEALAAAGRGGATPGEAAAAAGSALRLAGERAWREDGFAALLEHPVAEARRAAFRAMVGAVRGWKEKPALDGPFAERVIRAMKADPSGAGCAAVVLRALRVPAAAGPGDPAAADGGLWDLKTTLALSRAAAESGDPDVRGACFQALGALGLGDASTLGVLLAQEPAPRARVGIVRGFAKQKDAGSLAVLVRALEEDGDFSVRAAACEALGARKEGAREAVPSLAAAAAEDPSRLVRMQALLALHAIGGDAAAEAAVAAAKSEDFHVRAAAAGAALPLPALEGLATKDPAILVRESAAGEAGNRGRAGLEACLSALRDPDPVVAGTAASALGGMAPPPPPEPGKEAPKDAPKDAPKEPAPDPLTADEAARAAAAIEARLGAWPAPLAAPDDGADFRAAAIDALWKLRAPGAKALAEAFLSDPDPSVRAMAAAVLEGIDGKKPEVPLARRLLPFPDRAEILVVDEDAPRVRFETDRGAFTVRTIPSAAPVHVARFLARVRSGGYDGTIFHRVVPAFVVQGGDPRGDGSGSGGATIRQEFSAEPYGRGTLGVPRSDDPESGGCQLFFCHGATPHLDRRYTVTGLIVEGVDVIDLIDVGDRILRARVE
jgi:cyclophilin family peptidyl-prolyl cis-trans isomerase/HEAT repeat protein